ncbi:MAG: fluoride efflux transporter CrcB [Parvularculaceae bacterium]|jgi:CrcB protein|nr:fluoride efflux transporter CrcB [Parvularculaceae bacterium]
MKTLATFLAVAGGGAIGASLRHAVQIAATRAFGYSFPTGTLAVNVAGCFAMGLVVAWFAAREPNPGPLRAFLAVGVLGGFTTFSAFALDAVTLWRDKALAVAALYVCGSVVLSVGGLMAGLAVGRSLW